MRIGFRDAQTQRVFNDYERLEACFGPQIAARIASRMAVLTAADDLGRVPRRRPIRLRPIDGAPGQFAVDLAPPLRLRFDALDGDASIGSWEDDDARRTRIKEIEVVGVD